MLKLRISSNMMKYHQAYFEKIVLKKINEKHLNEIFKKEYIDLSKKQNKNFKFMEKDIHNFDKEIKEMILLLLDNWRNLAVGDCTTLRGLDDKYKNVINSLKEDMIAKNAMSKAVFTLLGYDNFISRDSSNTKKFNTENDTLAAKWTAYKWAELINLRTCAYCNRQYITCLGKKNGKSGIRADIDHYWPKSKYPHFSMSLYNWVPSCSICNSRLKGSMDVDITQPTLYEVNMSDKFKFSLSDFKLNKKRKKIRVVIDDINHEKELNKWFKKMRIQDQYKVHRNIAEEFVKKRNIYSRDIIKKIHLQAEKCEYIDDKTLQLLPMIVGYPCDEKHISEEPLGKMKYDFAKELEFI